MKIRVRCDISQWHKPGRVVYDALIPGSNKWAYLCADCFKQTGAKLGIGRGQKFICDPVGNWTKVAG